MGPKTEEVIDLSGNYSEKAEELKKNCMNKSNVTDAESLKTPYDSSELYRKMR